MKYTFTLLLLTIASLGSAQIPDGTFAPNFEAEDIDGNVQNLHELLKDGYKVVLDFSTTWCGPCWSYHETGALEELHRKYGPDGTQEVFVLFIESDDDTTMDDLLGNTGGTQGNWIENTPYPIVDNGAYISDLYEILGFPTIMTVCSNGLAYDTERKSAEEHYNYAMALACQAQEKDAALSNSQSFVSVCESPFNSSVDLYNLGNDNISSATITAMGCDNCPLVKEWTGDLAYFESESISFDDIMSSEDAFDLSFTVEAEDDYAANDVSEIPVSVGYVEATNTWTIEVTTDCYPEETAWKIFDELDVVVAENPAYTEPETTTMTEVKLPANGCYTIAFYDSYGDGLNGSAYAPDCTIDGMFKCYSSEGTILESDGSDQFSIIYENSITNGSVSNENIFEESIFTLGPNPSSDVINIAYSNLGTQDLSVNIHDLFGNKLYTEDFKNQNVLFQQSINVSDFNSGIYFLSIQEGERTYTKKFIVE